MRQITLQLWNIKSSIFTVRVSASLNLGGNALPQIRPLASQRRLMQTEKVDILVATI